MQPQYGDPQAPTSCYRHPDRSAGVTCQRCNRPICPSCMVQASVGFQCPECASARSTQVITGSDVFGRATDPIVTKVLIGLNVAAFVAAVVMGSPVDRAGGDLYLNWATYGPLVDNGEWHRLITGAFLHSGLIHLGMNMYLLWLLGRVIEPAVGRVPFGLLYFVSLMGGAAGVMLLDPTAPTVGASGAVFGLMGAMVVLQVRAGQNPWQSGILTLVVLNLVLTFTIPGISIGGHVGGLIAGSLSAFGLTVRTRGQRLPTIAHISGLIVFFAVLSVLAIVLAARALPDLAT